MRPTQQSSHSLHVRKRAPRLLVHEKFQLSSTDESWHSFDVMNLSTALEDTLTTICFGRCLHFYTPFTVLTNNPFCDWTPQLSFEDVCGNFLNKEHESDQFFCVILSETMQQNKLVMHANTMEKHGHATEIQSLCRNSCKPQWTEATLEIRVGQAFSTTMKEIIKVLNKHWCIPAEVLKAAGSPLCSTN